MRIRDYKRMKAFFESLAAGGVNGYLFIMILAIPSVGLAKIILKTCTKQNFTYNNFLIFCIIGLILSIILKMFNFNLTYRPLEILVCLIINIIVFIIVKSINKILKSKNM